MVNDKPRPKRSGSPLNNKAKEAKKVDCKMKSRASMKGGSNPKKNTSFKEIAHKNELSRKSEESFFDKTMGTNETNFVRLFNQFQRGFCKASALQQIAEQVCLQELKWYGVFGELETPELRVTAMQWHPKAPHVFVAGGKSGGLFLYTFNQLSQKELKSFDGIGPGGTIEAIRFNTKRSGVEVCTASVDGTVSSYNFETDTRSTLVDSENCTRVWFCSVDVHQDGKSVYAGDNSGNLAIHHLDSHKTSYGKNSVRLHKSKVKHLEFSPRDPNLMVTCSLDKTVKLWDIRQLSNKDSFVDCLQQNCAITSATFSQTDGCRLLTTDQKSTLCVYKAPLWTLEHEIHHPHRSFQHLTKIKACWHPQADIFVIGRYPDPKDMGSYDNLRSVDVFSASSGQLRHELTDTSRLITSLAQFNCSGSLLATSLGRTISVWRSK